MNLLHLESSPYLLQHAQNPVHWRAWNDASLDEARQSNRLMIISSGYAACHWCHVMEHECFEDQEVADVMNAHYISIKVDREERPDVDAVYMKAVQLMTRQGGWPMNVICLPDGRPVWGGTYFPKRDWLNALTQLTEMYRDEPSKMVEYAEKLHDGLQSISLIAAAGDDSTPDVSLLNPLIEKWKRSFDDDYGGYGRAPKFMLPNNFRFLLRYGFEKRDKALIDHVCLTLDRMAWGGIFDTVGGGFARYSVDMRWHIPHFEKMLYDNGQMVSLYADAYRFTGDTLYREIIEKTLALVERELTSPEGGFYCALDADSLNPEGQLEEGAYYIWRKEELEALLDGSMEQFSAVFNINEFGHWEHGRYVLIQNKSIAESAAALGIPERDLFDLKRQWEQLLLEERNKRPRPRLDDKQLTSWNAMMLNGFVDAFKATGHQPYLDTALRNARFIIGKMWSEDGHLFRNYKDGKSTIPGYLDDYAFTIEAFSNLYSATFDESWLRRARQLADYCLDRFYDSQSGFFWFTSDGGALIAPHYEIEDNVIPASNSVMAKNLHRLSLLLGNDHYGKVSQRMMAHILPLVDYPSSFSNWMDALLDHSPNAMELAVCGPDAITHALTFQRAYRPNVIVAGSTAPSTLPLLEGRFVENGVLFYVCRNKTCQLPERNLDAVLTATSPI